MRISPLNANFGARSQLIEPATEAWFKRSVGSAAFAARIIDQV